MTKHVHKYVRIKLGRNKDRIEYKCALPGCPHHLEKELVVGRISICNFCGDEFVMDLYSTKLAKPHCLNCGKNKEKIEKVRDIAAILEMMEK
jgi:hypothetical protein